MANRDVKRGKDAANGVADKQHCVDLKLSASEMANLLIILLWGEHFWPLIRIRKLVQRPSGQFHTASFSLLFDHYNHCNDNDHFDHYHYSHLPILILLHLSGKLR